ncbi:NAD-dependent epimerase/dehydratase family protein [Legionella maioricensis]|uniref:NAD(P)-dependent oxidoreductase n=1 Tax=Legionella maioricensis TaxID=2896528 RepID=A0A9X2CZH9_9GAMM|nr:NAD(P)-dependent oxidoreductase [Legionella maioricensis]MCL9683549.1 NAD(P)-dependent oxidoreductase [Legionella maioricensis]MCL9686848.1 NAD(P)-dependent oxidoreductase [Legionella maioricensis]
MPSLVILGAGGFLGKAIIEQGASLFPIKAVVRKKKSDTQHSDKITWFELDLLIPGALDEVLEKDDIIVNTAYIPGDNDSDNLQLINNVIDSCIRNKIQRLIHCSTANVVGAVKNCRIDESVVCEPLTQYEQVKFAIEERVLKSSLDGLDVIVLRPTAIVGPEGKNLLKLADALMKGSQFVNYLRASLFRNRKMHLVSVHNVAAAILHLSQASLSNRGIYFISSDDDPQNNFISIESILRETLGLGRRKIPLLPIPLSVLSILLKLKGRSGFNLGRTYDSKKLFSTNFTPVDSLDNAVNQFGKRFLEKNATGNLISDK